MNRSTTQHTLIMRRAYRRVRAWFRRDALRSALLLLLAFSLAEPLACFLHCQFQASDAHAAHQQGQHAAHHRHVQSDAVAPVHAVHSDIAATYAVQTVQAPISGGAAQHLCALSAEHDTPTPTELPPRPSHDHTAILLTLALLVLIALVQPAPPAPGHAPPQRSCSPPLRPPIQIPT